jgi:hypothetical protein
MIMLHGITLIPHSEAFFMEGILREVMSKKRKKVFNVYGVVGQMGMAGG